MIHFYEVSNGLMYPEDFDSILIISVKEYTKEEFEYLCEKVLITLNAESADYHNELMIKLVEKLCREHGFKEIFSTAYFAIK